MGRFLKHTGQCLVITGTGENLERLWNVFTNDPASGFIRHADAGYPDTITNVRKHGIDMPMLSA